MRILHVTPYMHKSFGGPVVVVEQLALMSTKSGVKVDIVTTSIGMSTNEVENLKSSYALNGIRLKIFDCGLLSRWFLSIAMLKWLWIEIKSFDLVHLHVPFTAPFFFAARFSQKAKIPYVISTHGLLSNWCLTHKRWKKEPYLNFLELENLQNAKNIFVTSHAECDELLTLKVRAKMFRMSLAFDFCSVPKSELKKSKKSIILLSVCRIHEVKNLLFLFEAVKSCLNNGYEVELHLAGDGEPKYIEKLKRYINNNALSNNIFWHGFLEKEGKKALYGLADALVLVSKYESFGIAAAEGLASGLPVIVSDQVGLSRDIENYDAGLVVKLDEVDALRDAIIEMKSECVVLRCKKGGQNLISDNCNSVILAKQLSIVYANAIS
jgi:glycosyltransferase involved in cell wall biosynthesis